MKTKMLLLSVIMGFIAHISFGQISKGSILLGGQLSFSNQTTSSSQKITGFAISPAIGEAIKENLVLGFDAGYAYSDYKNTANANYKQAANNFGAGVFLRKYVPVGKGFYIFGQGRFGASYNTSKTEQTNIITITDNIKGYALSLGFYPGISYQVNRKLQLEAGFNNVFSIAYQHSKDTQTGINTNESVTNKFSLLTSLDNMASALTLGFRVLLAK
ncbi:MAG: TonB-dependent receptor [Bacteroidetes bacterium]|nr:TonB-dependent receptor [Bacteroidota bacterium]MBS1973101.1 TonB-dependent receptor [Bacteroidota bacterium]